MKTSTPSCQLSFDELYEELVLPVFARAEAHDRRGHNSVYSLMDALKSGYAIFALKHPSLYALQRHTQAEQINFKNIFGIKKCPTDNGLRTILDQVDSAHLRTGFSQVLPFLESKDVLDHYRYYEGHLICSIDGVEHFCSKRISCPHCLLRQHRDGSQSYYHQMLSAALVCPGQREVFVLDNEPIVQQDGVQKNDCEQNAARRLFAHLRELYASRPMIYVLDALYACGPIVQQIQAASPHWKYVINVTPTGHKYLFEQFEQLDHVGQISWVTKRRKSGRHELGFVNGLSLNQSHANTKVNLLYYRWTSPKGEQKVFTFITNIPLHRSNAMTIGEIGRSRWKIENDVFNTLKNQDYNYEHNYGHGQEHLATNFAYLMMLAFTVDQLQQRCNRYFQSLLRGLKTRVKIWQVTLAMFTTVACQSMEELQRNLLEMYQIRLV